MVKKPLIGMNWLAIGIILMFIGVAIASSINLNVVKASNDCDYEKVITQARESDLINRKPIALTALDGPIEVIDQQQTTHISWGVMIYSSRWEAQSFIPTINSLSKIEVLFFKSGFPEGGINLTVHIRANLTGEDLAILSQDASIIPSQGCWVEFDIPDITVIPGNNYYIICSTNSLEDMIGYCWSFNRYNVYDRGEAWRSYDYGATWEIREDPPDWVGIDYCFITYGLDEPPNIPTINGPSSGAVGVEYNYTTLLIDQDTNNVFCKWYWDDGYISDWLGPYSSGQIVNASHTWTQKGIYEIRAKLKDQYGAESNWSEPFEMYIDIDFSIKTQGGFGITAIVKNIGDEKITNVQWTLTLTGGNIFLGKSKSGSISSLEPNATATLKEALIFGFGRTTINVELTWSEEETIRKSATGIIFLFFALGVK